MKSLRYQLLLGLLALMLLSGSMVLGMIYLLAIHNKTTTMDAFVAQRARLLAGLVEQHDLTSRHQAIDEVFAHFTLLATEQRFNWQLRMGDKDMLDVLRAQVWFDGVCLRDLSETPCLPGQRLELSQAGFDLQSLDGEPWQVYSLYVPHLDAWFQVAYPAEHPAEVSRHLFAGWLHWYLLIWSLGIGVPSALYGYWVMRPLKKVQQQLDRGVAVSDLTLERCPQEFAQLRDHVQQAMEQGQARVDREQQLNRALLSESFEVLDKLRETMAQPEGMMARMGYQLNKIEQLLRIRELQLELGRPNRSDSAYLSVSDQLERGLERLTPLSQQRGLALTTALTRRDCVVAIPESVMRGMLDNLLEVGIRQAPHGSTLVVELECLGDHCALLLQLERTQWRPVRWQSQRSSESGLPLVRRLADKYGWDFTVSQEGEPNQLRLKMPLARRCA
ncbi:histidine kinase [Ferrimonas marina]|uniref:histidine kinase n=1 Tax=Ferrimonas marina TaxID=299255 RepID=A0A1M5ZG07_9GAMM|nr:HAMP domain-containing histidine kinase [Ferrimonas marina]SHI23188.1 Signal transduction histidine kinase [Ferrimonas marina]